MFSVKDLNCMIDLHLHLDGAISISSAKELAKLQDIEIPSSDAELEKLIRVSDDCKDLMEFLEKFAFPCSLLQTGSGIRKAVSNLLKELKEEGVIYAEIRFAPQLSTKKGLSQEAVVEAALEGLTEGLKDSFVMANLILCCMRGEGNEEKNRETVEVARKYLGRGVCALDLAGAESVYKTEEYEELFAYAELLDIPFTIHAGEADGPKSVWDAISYGACRIGHGVRSLEDEKLVEYLVKNEIPLEICPTSNINTAVFRNISEYPLRALMDAGLALTINTDDPSIEATSIKKEYQKLIDSFNLEKADVLKFLENAAKYSFASEKQREHMMQKIKEYFG